jgi:hypothetical protein
MWKQPFSATATGVVAAHRGVSANSDFTSALAACDNVTEAGD